jgi:hypothetical protein
MGKLTKLLRKAGKATQKRTKNQPAVKSGERVKTTKQVKEDQQRRKNQEAAKTVQKRGSIAKKATVSKTDIQQANTARQFDTLQRRIDGMNDGLIKKSMQKMLNAQRKQFEKMQAAEVDKAGRKSAQAARDKKMKGKVTLPPVPFKKGGYNKGKKK